jgi:hypothetical protein
MVGLCSAILALIESEASPQSSTGKISVEKMRLAAAKNKKGVLFEHPS